MLFGRTSQRLIHGLYLAQIMRTPDRSWLSGSKPVAESANAEPQKVPTRP
jgi:hypothetical protein